jgi:hypothetical protein
MSSSDIEVLVIVRVADQALRQIAAVDSRLHVVDGRGWFDVEHRRLWDDERVIITPHVSGPATLASIAGLNCSARICAPISMVGLTNTIDWALGY